MGNSQRPEEKSSKLKIGNQANHGLKLQGGKALKVGRPADLEGVLKKALQNQWELTLGTKIGN